MKHPKLLSPVTAMILVGSTTFISLASAPTVDTRETPVSTTPLATLINRPVTIVPTLHEPVDRWERFQNEFGQDQEYSPAVLDSIARTKYGVDLTAYTINTVLERLESIFELRYTHGRVVSAAAVPRTAPLSPAHGPVSLEDARLKFDFQLDGGKPYIGLRLVLPFGN